MTLPGTEIAPRRVLVVAYYFPPMGLSGVQRTLKFVKYLPQFGWLPTVLTVEPRGYFARDESLLQDLDGRDIRVVRTPAAGPGRFFAKKEVVSLPPERTRKFLSRISDAVFFPDNKIGWKKRAVAVALALHSETPFDLVFTTAPPFTDFLIGSAIKKHIDRPLVFDYRAPQPAAAADGEGGCEIPKQGRSQVRAPDRREPDPYLRRHPVQNAEQL